MLLYVHYILAIYYLMYNECSGSNRTVCARDEVTRLSGCINDTVDIYSIYIQYSSGKDRTLL